MHIGIKLSMRSNISIKLSPNYLRELKHHYESCSSINLRQMKESNKYRLTITNSTNAIRVECT